MELQRRIKYYYQRLECKECHKEVVVKQSPGQEKKYCSDNCSLKHWRRLKKKRKDKAPISFENYLAIDKEIEESKRIEGFKV